jgi:NAD-dependent deacetylase
MNQQLITQAARLLQAAQQVVCLTGAGVSAESGVATFRDPQSGLWAKFDLRQLASPEGFAQDPALVWGWYMARLATVETVQPNLGHRALAQIEALVPSFSLFTQNVDDLHERAGSRQVAHLHGRIDRFRCNRCEADHELQPAERQQPLPPACRHCGGTVRPAVVWFGELLPLAVLEKAWQVVASCDLLLVVGTSGIVYPAAELPFAAKRHGAKVIEVNPDPGPIAAIADLVLAGASGVVLPQVVTIMEAIRGTSATS